MEKHYLTYARLTSKGSFVRVSLYGSLCPRVKGLKSRTITQFLDAHAGELVEESKDLPAYAPAHQLRTKASIIEFEINRFAIES